MSERLSKTQRYWLEILAKKRFSIVPLDHNGHCPIGSEVRAFRVLERRGLVRWRTVDEGFGGNAFVITNAGRKAASDD